MKPASLIALLDSVAAGVAGVVRMVSVGDFRADFPEIAVVIAVPFVLSALGIAAVPSAPTSGTGPVETPSLRCCSSGPQLDVVRRLRKGGYPQSRADETTKEQR